jgi:hypothetical protein
VGGADALALYTTVELEGKDLSTIGVFPVEEGERVAFSLVWHRSHEEPPPPFDANVELARCE